MLRIRLPPSSPAIHMGGGEGGVGVGVEVFCLGYVPTIPHSECHIWDKW